MMARARAAWLIMRGDVEGALALLSQYYGVSAPRVRVGLPRGRRGVAGCYDPARATIYVRSRVELRNPLVVLHEFYHHLRYVLGEHRGTEKHADRYAAESVRALWKLINQGRRLFNRDRS